MSSLTLHHPQRTLSRRWIIAGLGLIIVTIAAALLANNAQQPPAAQAVTTVPVAQGNVSTTIAGTGAVAAAQTLPLSFQTGGTVTELLVKEGDTVSAGQVIAKLDDRALQLQVSNAQASLQSAQAKLAQAQQGNAKPEDITAAQTQLTSAQASYNKIAAGATPAQIAAAQASVASAQAAYNAAVQTAGAYDATLASSKATLEKATLALQQAQANYDKVAWRPDISGRPESTALQTATIDYQQAKGNYESLTKTAGTDAQAKIQSAQSQLAAAQANLASLTVDQNSLVSAQASVDSAQASLDKLTAPATATDLSIQQASVAQAEQALKQAQYNLESATLKAPFAGVVTAVSVIPGSTASSSTAIVTLMDRSTLHVDLKLNENDVTKIQTNLPVSLTISSLSGWKASGVVSNIASVAENTNGVVTYAVRVSFAGNDPKVRVGMTANTTIITAQKNGVLLVPNTALLPKGPGKVVQVMGSDGKTTSEVAVKTGLSDGTRTEITSGLKDGDIIVAIPRSTGTITTNNNNAPRGRLGILGL